MLLALLLWAGGTGLLVSSSVSLGSEALSGSLSCSMDTLSFAWSGGMDLSRQGTSGISGLIVD